MAMISTYFVHRHPRAALRLAGAGLAFAAASDADASTPDEDACNLCVNAPAPEETLVGTPGAIQCVHYANFRSGLNRGGDAYEWAEYKPCGTVPDGETCLVDAPKAGALLVCLRGENGCDKAAGHVAVIECVTGNWAKVSEYNYGALFKNKYRSDRCVDLKKALDAKTPYKYVLPYGEPIEVGEQCDKPIKLIQALVKPDPGDPNAGTVAVQMYAPQCSKAKYWLNREVYKQVYNRNILTEVPIPGKKLRVSLESVYLPYNDAFTDVPPCSRFDYGLERELEPPLRRQTTVSPKVTGVNLQAPGDLVAAKIDKKWGTATLRWNASCPNYQSVHPTEYHLSYSSGGLPPSTPQKLLNIKPATDGVHTFEVVSPSMLANSTYNFTLYAFNNYDLSPPSNTAIFTTGNASNAQTSPQPAQPVLTVNCQQNTVTASWTPSAGDPKYTVTYTRPTLTQPETKTEPASSATTLAIPATIDGAYTVKLTSTLTGRPPSASTTPVTVVRDCLAEPPKLLPATTTPCAGAKLTWSVDPRADPKHLKSFEIYRVREGQATPQLAGSVPAAVKTFVDGAAAPGHSHKYFVRATYDLPDAGVQVSAPSLDSAMLPPGGPPAAPDILTTAVDRDRVQLKFRDNSSNETHFLVKRWMTSESGTPVTYTLDANPGTGDVTWLEPGTLPVENRRYIYRVFAANGVCKEDTLLRSLRVETRRLQAPTNLTALVSGASNLVSWKDANQFKTEFKVYRKRLDEATWKLDATVKPQTSTYGYLDTKGGDAQYYVSTSYEGDRTRSEGPASTPFAFIRPAVPNQKACTFAGKPVLTSARNVDDPQTAQLVYSYAAARGVVTRVQYSVTKSGPWVAMQDLPANKQTAELDLTAYMDQELRLRIVGYDPVTGCYTTPSAEALIYPLPPPVVQASLPPRTGCAGLTVQWYDRSKHGSHFQVQYNTLEDPTWRPVTNEKSIQSGAQVSLCDAAAKPLGTYRYRVRSTYQTTVAGKQVIVSASAWSTHSPPAALPLAKGQSMSLPLANPDMELTARTSEYSAIKHWGPNGGWAANKSDHVRPNNAGIGASFGYYAAGVQETVGQLVDVRIAAGNTYTFKGWVNGGGDFVGKAPFQIGYATIDNNLASFKPLKTTVVPAAKAWASSTGVSYSVTAADKDAIGKQLVVRLGAKADGGDSDIWFDNLTLTLTKN